MPGDLGWSIWLVLVAANNRCERGVLRVAVGSLDLPSAPSFLTSPEELPGDANPSPCIKVSEGRLAKLGYRCLSLPNLTSQLAFFQSGTNSSESSLRLPFQNRSFTKRVHWSKKTAKRRMAATLLKAMTATPMIFHSLDVPNEEVEEGDGGVLL
ncbi:unnamed protein product [Somion occarium]|uniref:Uncharacterized protein n=1 Tax=Somion occarium TaxID=3059160 RepID=A0ABP1CFN7_9APHY